MPQAGDDWKVVVRRRNRLRHTASSNPKPIRAIPNPITTPTIAATPIPWTPSDPTPPSPTSITHLVHKIHRSTSKLESSAFYCRFLDQLNTHPTLKSHPILSCTPNPPRMVVYGIGSIESYEPPRLQLSLALLLHKHLSLPEPIEIFDPILTSLECAAIGVLGFDVLETDEMGRREVTSPTLFYMPHCEAKMYDNLLAENWKEEGGGLDGIVLLGNSFKEYEAYVSGVGRASRVVGEAGYVVKASWIATEVGIVEGGGVEEDEVEDGFFKAFNNTNWHCFFGRHSSEMNNA